MIDPINFGVEHVSGYGSSSLTVQGGRYMAAAERCSMASDGLPCTQKTSKGGNVFELKTVLITEKKMFETQIRADVC